MSTTASPAYAPPIRRAIASDHVMRSALSIGAFTVVIYEAAAPLGYVATDTGGYAAAGIGLLVGGVLGLWK